MLTNQKSKHQQKYVQQQNIRGKTPLNGSIYCRYAFNNKKRCDVLSSVKRKDNFFNNKIGDSGLEQLCRDGSKNFMMLELGGNELTTQCFITFSRQNWNNLTSLCIDRNLINSQGCKHISRTPMSNLHVLTLSFNQIDSVGLLNLCKSQWKQLIVLSLGSNFITRGIQELVRGCWKKMEMLLLDNNQLTPKEIPYLCTIQSDAVSSVTLWDNWIANSEKRRLFDLLTCKFKGANIDLDMDEEFQNLGLFD